MISPQNHPTYHSPWADQLSAGASFLVPTPQTQNDLRAVLERDVVLAAPSLLGWRLRSGECLIEIVETEAYRWDDPGCHAYGRSKMKNMAMLGPAGRAYVYFTYGNHWMLNVVAHPEGDGSAVLIRAGKPLEGGEVMAQRRGVSKATGWLSGPGKLAQALGIDASQNGCDFFPSESSPLQLLPPDRAETRVLVTPRIGLHPQKGFHTPWRFVDADALEFSSKPGVDRRSLTLRD